MAMPSMSPVIRRCLSGDQQAQEELVLAAQNRVYYHCRKMLKHEEDALDATQEILISMLTRLDRLQDPEAFWGWLSAMTANHCRNVLTRGRREAQIPEDDEGNSLLDAFESLDEQTVPDKALDNDETRRMIVELVDQLPPPQRQCVLMFYYEEMSVKDIAAALETSEGTVKSRLNYARKAIKSGVDAYAAQGVKLYSALPFLVYFLQRDAGIGGLSASAAEALARSVLAGAAGTAAAGTAAAGAAGTVAPSGGAAAGTAAASGGTASHALSGLLAHKAALGLAGLAAAGAVAGGAALYQPEPEPAEDPAPIVEVAEPQPIPEPEPPPEPEPTPAPEPEPAPAPEPVQPQPGPAPEPDPVPVEEPEPSAEPQPASTPEVRMNFSSYSAGYGDNVAFPISMISNADTPYDGIVYSSTNPAVADVSPIGGIALLSPGTAEIIATFPDDNNYQVRLPVTVEGHYAWSYQWADDPLYLTVGQSGSNYLQQYSTGRDSTMTGTTWSCSDPSVVSISSSGSNFCNVTALSPGTATITGVYQFDAWTNVGTFPMTDAVSFQVIVS
ncbi:sigma-70 family RNA polymerase sigma factor [Oscillibacter valericigenes]|uniref:Sigma-70 family RNA polymerase sigma factor n=1 Tax=Oscillibacter valericigenes TaxID=351091 RepID=A0ABS2FV27_9FIRM|nr:sigma-70 family RNA polymerase sigma factor [Oscillibacter valericigenes]MBM6851489.1 sigma-70 family RNA polymerase sigma factor [Oscillibacter valericigenes]